MWRASCPVSLGMTYRGKGLGFVGYRLNDLCLAEVKVFRARRSDPNALRLPQVWAHGLGNSRGIAGTVRATTE